MTNSLPWNVYPNYIHSRCMHVALGILCDTVCNHKIQEANLKLFPLIVQLPNPSKKCNRVLTRNTSTLPKIILHRVPVALLLKQIVRTCNFLQDLNLHRSHTSSINRTYNNLAMHASLVMK